MEALSIVASIIGLTQLTGRLTSICYTYLAAVKREPKHLSELVNELDSLGKELNSAKTLFDRDIAGNPVVLQALSELLEDLYQKLSELDRKLKPKSRLGRKFPQLRWPLKEAETLDLLSIIGRIKSSLMLFLSINTGEIVEMVQKIEAQPKKNDDAQIATEKRREVLDWIYPQSFDKQHMEASARRHQDTCKWILGEPKLQSWLSTDETWLLYVFGPSGSGKTLLSSFVIDYLLAQAEGNNYGVAYVYFDLSRQNKQQQDDILASLVKQLAYQVPDLPKRIEGLHGRLAPQGRRPTLQELFEALLEISKPFPQLFLVFDAADECDQRTQQHGLLQLFHRMKYLRFKVFVTSRPDAGGIHGSLLSEVKINLSENTKRDIEIYILARINENPRLSHFAGQGDLKDVILRGIVESSQGMFLLANLHAEYICQQSTVEGVSAALERLKNSPFEANPLESTYQRAIETIRGSPKSYIDLALKVLSWLMEARRGLTVNEMRLAVSVEPDRYELEDLDLPDLSTLLDVCAGLVTIDGVSDTIRLVHYTAQEYLSKNSIIPSHVSLNIASTCCTYLSFNIFADGACDSRKSFESRLEAHPFFGYAATHLIFHLKACEQASSAEAFLGFLRKPGNITSYLQAKHFLEHNRGEFTHDQYPKGFGPLHIASSIGHIIVIEQLLREGADTSTPTSDGRTALLIAASEGHARATTLLLEMGADHTEKDRDGWTALHWAAFGGHELVVQKLLARGADISMLTQDQKSILCLAASEGHESIATLLLEKGADHFDRDIKGWTALHWAVFRGQENVVRILLDHDADAFTPDIHMREPLSLAASEGHDILVNFLIKRGASPLIIDKDGRNALHWAASKGHEVVVNILLQNEAKTQLLAVDRYGQTPEQLAESEGQDEVSRLLAQRRIQLLAPHQDDPKQHQEGTDLLVGDQEGPVNPLGPHELNTQEYQDLTEQVKGNGDGPPEKRSPASFREPQPDGPKVVERVDSVPISSPDNDELLSAILNGDEARFQQMLEDGADISMADESGRTPLSLAAHEGQEVMVQLLLDRNADPLAIARDGTTALCLAAENGHEAIVRLLHEKGARLDTIDSNGWTPLYRAVSNEHEAVVRLILEKKTAPLALGEETSPPFATSSEWMVENSPNFTRPDGYGRTPLYRAVFKGHEFIVRFLFGVGVDLSDHVKDRRTILCIAASQGHEPIARFLLEEGKADHSIPDKDGWAPLHWAAFKGHGPVVKLLIEAGADVSAATKNGRTVLSLAASEGHEPVVKALLEKSADFSTPDNYQRTPLYLAAFSGQESVVQLLLKNNANHSVPDRYGRVPLYCAAHEGHKAVVRVLLDSGASPSHPDDRGYTPLHKAVSHGSLSIAQLLLQKSANVRAVARDGKDILSIAASQGHAEVTRLLLEHGADTSVRDTFGRTPLYQAASEGHELVVLTLLDRGASASTTDKFGRTPLFQAASRGHEKVVRLLLERGANPSVAARDGRTALRRAKSEGYSSIIELLETALETSG